MKPLATEININTGSFNNMCDQEVVEGKNDFERQVNNLPDLESFPLWQQRKKLVKGGYVEIDGVVYDDEDGMFLIDSCGCYDYAVLKIDGKRAIYDLEDEVFIEDDDVRQGIIDRIFVEDEKIDKAIEEFILKEAKGDTAKEWVLRAVASRDVLQMLSPKELDGITFYFYYEDENCNECYLGYKDGKCYIVAHAEENDEKYSSRLQKFDSTWIGFREIAIDELKKMTADPYHMYE